MDDVQLSNWYAGHDRQPVEAYRLDDIKLARALGVTVGTPVWLSDYTLTKTQLVHKEINFQDYRKLPEILAEGFITPANQKRSVLITHADINNEHYRFWRVCLKATREDEVFVTMFHRSHLKDVRRVYRRALRQQKFLRDHKSKPVRQIIGRTGAKREGGAP